MDLSNSFEVVSSWSVKAEREIEDCIIWRSDDETLKIQEYTSSPITLLRTENDMEHPSLTVTRKPSVRSSFSVDAIDILCTARNMEVYGSRHEYIETIPGMRLHLDNLPENTKLYMFQHSFNEPIDRCRLKLVSLCEKGELWVQSIHITVAKAMPAAPLPGLTPSIDMDKVKALMADMGTPLPSNAQGLMAAMEAMQHGKQNTSDQVSSILMNLMGAGNMMPSSGPSQTTHSGAPAGATGDATSPSPLQSIMQLMTMMQLHNADANSDNNAACSDRTCHQDAPPPGPNKDSCPQEPQHLYIMKSYIEQFVKQEISQAEERIITSVKSYIDGSEQRLNSRLDKIFEKLTNKEISS